MSKHVIPLSNTIGQRPPPPPTLPPLVIREAPPKMPPAVGTQSTIIITEKAISPNRIDCLLLIFSHNKKASSITCTTTFSNY
jgi:hypothetical protein